jgi:hypothetical protein
VVPGDDHDPQVSREQRLQVLLRDPEFVGVALSREVATDDDQVGRHGDGLGHGAVQQLAVEVRRPTVQVRQLCDDERVALHRRRV